MRDSNELSPLDSELITRYLSGQGTSADVAAVTAWSAGHDDRVAMLHRLQAAWTAAEPAEVPITDHDRFMAQLRQRVRVASPEGEVVTRSTARSGIARQTPSHGTRSIPSANVLGRWMGVAAGVAIAAIGLVLVARRPNAGSHAIGTSSTGRSYATTAGQRATIPLGDGTTVMLAPGTTMVVDGHVVSLVGEAFFTVHHHAGTPWIVRTGGVETRVLGTAFDVRRYADDGATRVVVTEGKVTTGGRMTAPVTAGMIAYATDSTVRSLVASDPETLTSWTRGRLVFHNTPVSDVLSAVSQWYGVAIRVSDPAVGKQLLTAELDVERSRSEFIAALEVVLDVQVTAVGDTLMITPRRARTFRGTPTRDPATPFTPRTEIGR